MINQRKRLLFSKGSNQYLLQDTFSDTVAAGSVNGTMARPVGGPRVVIDTNSKISIINGVLSFATGEAATDGVGYSSKIRTAGRILLYEFTSSDNIGNISGGWSNTQSGTGIDIVRMSGGANGVIGIVANSTGNVQVGTYLASTLYTLVIILRSNGTFYFIKGGSYTNWTMLWNYDAGNTTPIFPRIYTGNTVTTSTIDNVRIPPTLWYPLPTASDSFNRSNGALGSTDGAAIAELGGSGLTWVFNSGIWTIASNAAINTPTLASDVITNGGFDSDTVWSKGTGWTIAAGVATHASGTAANITEPNGAVGTWYQVDWTITSYVAGQFSPIWGSTNATVKRTSAATFVDVGRAIANTNLGISTNSTADGNIDNVSFKPLTLSELFASITTSQANDVIVSVDVTLVTGCPAGVVMNLDSTSAPANFVIAYHDGTNAKLDKCVGGVYTNVISAAATYSAGATLKVIKQGTSYALYYNNAKVGSTSTISDAGIISNTTHGLFNTYIGNSLDNFYIFPSGTNNEYSALNAF